MKQYMVVSLCGTMAYCIGTKAYCLRYQLEHGIMHSTKIVEDY